MPLKKGGIFRFNIVFILLAFLVLASPALGLKVFPTLTELGENYHKKQSFILTVLNDGPKTEDVAITIKPDSYYLEDYVTIEPKGFILKPNSKQNVQLTTFFPKNLSPEKHKLNLHAAGKGSSGEECSYTFTVPGIAKPNLKVDDIYIDDIAADESLIINVVLDNLGNVIARARPVVEIRNESGVLGELNYESVIMVMPFEKYNLSLMYDTSSFGEGDFSVDVAFLYNGGLETNKISKGFSITKAGGMNANFGSGFLANAYSALSFISNPYVVITLILAVLLFYVFRKPEHLKKLKLLGKQGHSRTRYPKEINLKLDNLAERHKKIDKEVNSLVNSTHKFVEDSNGFLRARFGEGKYEFK